MREISYKCDRCKKPMTGRAAVKLAITLQRGTDPSEKMLKDFCPKCFVKVKKGFEMLLSDIDFPVTEPEKTVTEAPPKPEKNVTEVPVKQEKKMTETPVKQEKKVETPVKPKETPGGYHAETVGPVTKIGSNYAFAVEAKVPRPEPEQKDEGIPEGAAQKDEVTSGEMCHKREGVIMGPLSEEEHALILKLHVEEGLEVAAIAMKMNRLTRGINRCINAARKSGELDRLKKEFAERQKSEPEPVPEAVEDEEPESYAGTGVSNTRILKDSYTAPPQTEVVDGKRHDIGAILALAKAGWNPKEIASEKHYDEDVVRMLLEKYMR